MRLLGYIRVSTDDQAREGQSIEIQRLQIQQFCATQGHDLVDVLVDDGVSASIDFERRPAGADLRDRLLNGEADGMVCQRMDRAFRVALDGLTFFTWLDRQGFVFRSVNEAIDSATPEGMMMVTMLLGLAECERKKIQQRSREVTRGLREQGKAWGGTPFGCVRVGDRIFRDPEQWQHRELIIELRETGLSLRAIAAELNERRILSPSGGRVWHVSTLKGILGSHADLESIPELPEPPDAPASADVTPLREHGRWAGLPDLGGDKDSALVRPQAG